MVQKPIPHSQTENPREFEINQIRRRFHPEESFDEDGTHLSFRLTPTDPDFSFDLKHLECRLHVPPAYPYGEKPFLEILNQGLDSKYINLVQQRFEELTSQPGTLLRWTNLLDRSLCQIFACNLVTEEQTRTNDVGKERVQIASTPNLVNPLPGTPGGIMFAQEKNNAQLRRQREISQLTARLGRSPLFSKLADNVSFNVPIQPLKPHMLPASLKSIKTVKLTVPELYPLEPCRIECTGISDKAARNAEAAFDRHVIETAELSLVAHINFLAATIHTLATQPSDEGGSTTNIRSSIASMSLKDSEDPVSSASASQKPAATLDHSRVAADSNTSTEVTDRPHVHFIPRPPEWTVGDDSDSDSEISDDSGSEDNYTDEDEDEDYDGDHNTGGGVPVPETPAQPAGRGVSLSFPSLDLYGIELLELKSLSLTLKCERCKELLDMKNIRIGDDGITNPRKRVDSCKKCGNYLSVGRF